MHRPFQINAEIEIVKRGRIFLNKKRVELLRQIHFTGSILSASKKMQISYQQAWTFIKEINEISPIPVVVRQRGGVNGGGAEITKYGMTLIEKYILMERKHEEFLLQLEDEMKSCFF